MLCTSLLYIRNDWKNFSCGFRRCSWFFLPPSIIAYGSSIYSSNECTFLCSRECRPRGLQIHWGIFVLDRRRLRVRGTARGAFSLCPVSSAYMLRLAQERRTKLIAFNFFVFHFLLFHALWRRIVARESTNESNSTHCPLVFIGLRLYTIPAQCMPCDVKTTSPSAMKIFAYVTVYRRFLQAEASAKLTHLASQHSLSLRSLSGTRVLYS